MSVFSFLSYAPSEELDGLAFLLGRVKGAAENEAARPLIVWGSAYCAELLRDGRVAIRRISTDQVLYLASLEKVDGLVRLLDVVKDKGLST